MKKALVVIIAVLIVIVAFVASYYFGYSVTEPQTQVELPNGVEVPPNGAEAPPNAVEGPPDETAEVNGLKTVIFTEEEINALMSRVASLIAESGLPAKLNYARARLAEDRMFVSLGAEALDMELEARDIEVYFQGTEVSASGKVPLGGIDTNFSIKATIAINDGKLCVAIEEIKPAAVSFMLLYGRGIDREELNQYLNQKLAEIPFPLPLQELEEIAVEEGKLIIRGR